MPASKETQVQHAKDWEFVTQACMNVKGCVGITAWGITDKFSWIPYTFEGEGYELIWDEQYQEKRAYKEIIKVMKK
jgi:endo-1,4-beta-xylanase